VASSSNESRPLVCGALDVEAGLLCAPAEAPAASLESSALPFCIRSRVGRLCRSLLRRREDDAPQLSAAELAAQLEDCASSSCALTQSDNVEALTLCAPFGTVSELLAMLDLYLELNPSLGSEAQAHAERKLRSSTVQLSEGRAGDSAAHATRLQTVRLEDALVGVARALHAGGCPVWRLEFNLLTVARGLGLPGTQFGVFPSFILVSFSRLLASAAQPGGQTMYIRTNAGFNMDKLEAADALARKISSYATNTPTPYKLKTSSAAGTDDMAAAAASALSDVPRRVAELRGRFADAKELAHAILELASGGPGFFMYNKHVGAAADEEEERLWGAEGTLHGPEGSIRSSAPSPPASRAPSGPLVFDDIAVNPSPLRHISRREAHRRRRAAFVAIAVEDTLEALKAIEAAPALYPQWSQVAAMGVASAGCAPVFFAGGGWEALTAGLLGGMVGFMGTVASVRGDRLLRAFEFLAAVICSFLARIADGLITPICLQTTLLSALIWLVQGWTMTNAVVEIATKNPMTGTSHLFSGIVTTAMMGFGLDVGSAVADLFGVPAASEQSVDALSGACARHLPWAARIPIFVPVTLSFSLLLNAHRRQLGPMSVLAALAFAISTAIDFAPRLQPLNSFLSAAVVGVCGNLFANATGRPAMAATSSGIFILVPGCLALRSVTALFGGAGVGLALTSKVLSVAVSIGAGIFMASLLVVPREVTHVRKQALKADVMLHGGYTRTLAMSPVSL